MTVRARQVCDVVVRHYALVSSHNVGASDGARRARGVGVHLEPNWRAARRRCSVALVTVDLAATVLSSGEQGRETVGSSGGALGGRWYDHHG